MRRLTAFVLVAVAGALLFALAPRLSLAEGPQDSRAQTTIEGLTPGSGDKSVVLSARLKDAAGQPIKGEPVAFFVVTTIFGERLMKVGEPLTDATGTAYVVYEPTWRGQTRVVVRFGGDDANGPAQTGITFNATTPVTVHQNADFGLDEVRAWLPVAVGVIVLGVWAAVGFVMFWTLVGIPAAAPPRQAPAYSPMPSVPALRPARLAPGFALAGVAVLLAAGGGWFLLSNQPNLRSFLPGQLMESNHPMAQAPGSALSMPVVSREPLGNAGTAHDGEEAEDIATDGSGTFVLAGTQLLAVSGGSERAIADGSRADWLTGASAIAAAGGKLYVAGGLSGDITVLDEKGDLERTITPAVPAGDRPLRPAAIAVAQSGDIWISDPENHRVLQVDSDGTFLRSIGQDVEVSHNSRVRSPAGLALDEAGNVYVVDADSREVKEFSQMGVFIAAFGGSGPEQPLQSPRDVAVDASGTVYVTCDGHHEVHAFGANGKYLGYVTADSASTHVMSPYGIAAGDGKLYVTDRTSAVLAFQLPAGR